MNKQYFVDTNIFVYARDRGAGRKQEVAMELISQLWKNSSGRISYQVLAEYFSVLSSKYSVKDDAILKDLEELESWNPIPIDYHIFLRTKRLRNQYTLSWWDCQIIASAEHSQCQILLTEDLSNNATYGTVVVENPFESL